MAAGPSTAAASPSSAFSACAARVSSGPATTGQTVRAVAISGGATAPANPAASTVAIPVGTTMTPSRPAACAPPNATSSGAPRASTSRPRNGARIPAPTENAATAAPAAANEPVRCSTSSTIASPELAYVTHPDAHASASARAPRRLSNAEYTDMEPRRLSGVQLPAPFRLEDDQIVADLPHARAVFSTARGGVSSGPYDSLNLGMLTDDAKANVDENRRRLGERIGHPWPRFCYGRQVHGATVRRATEPPSAARPYTEEDGQATALTDAAAIVFVADCLPILLAAGGAVAALHGGWRPLAGGIVDEGIAALREVGGDGSDHRRARPERARLLLRGVRGGPRALRGLRRAPRRQSRHRRRRPRAARGARRRGPRRRDLHDLLRARHAVLAPARQRRHRPPGGGRVPRLITGLDATRVRANLDRIREEIGRDDVQILAAVKYVPLEELDVLGEAGVTLLGENRAQDLEAKATAHPEFRWHFIGQLQSRKVKQIVGHVELIHSVASESALRQLDRHAAPQTEILLEVNVAGEPGKAGIDPAELAALSRAGPGEGHRPDDDAAVRLRSRGEPAVFRPAQELAYEHNLTQLSMGTSQDYAVAAAEGATIVRIGTTLYT